MTRMMQSVGDSNSKQIIIYDLVCVEQGTKEIGALICSVFLQNFFEG